MLGLYLRLKLTSSSRSNVDPNLGHWLRFVKSQQLVGFLGEPRIDRLIVVVRCRRLSRRTSDDDIDNERRVMSLIVISSLLQLSLRSCSIMCPGQCLSTHAASKRNDEASLCRRCYRRDKTTTTSRDIGVADDDIVILSSEMLSGRCRLR